MSYVDIFGLLYYDFKLYLSDNANQNCTIILKVFYWIVTLVSLVNVASNIPVL